MTQDQEVKLDLEKTLASAVVEYIQVSNDCGVDSLAAEQIRIEYREKLPVLVYDRELVPLFNTVDKLREVYGAKVEVRGKIK